MTYLFLMDSISGLMRKEKSPALIFLIVFLTFITCKNSTPPPPKIPKRPEILEGGKIIKFHPESPALKVFKSAKVTSGDGFVNVSAPARIIASISTSVRGGEKIILFESPEVTSLYSTYMQAKVSYTRSGKNLSRLRDMYKNQIATQKDIIEVETEVGHSHAVLSENEGKLRALGFNPAELDTVRSNMVWLICDVPESSLHSIKKGQVVDLFFNSFPDVKFQGKAEAIGDNVDPSTRTIKVRVSMPNKEGKLLPGMFARVAFGDLSNSTFVLPTTSVMTVEGKEYVFVRKNGSEFERRNVVTGNASFTEINILQGIFPDEEVVTEGTIHLKGLSFGY